MKSFLLFVLVILAVWGAAQYRKTWLWKSHYNSAVVHADRGEYDRAIADYNRVLEINPEHLAAYFGRGRAYAETGEHERAISDFTVVIESDPEDALAYYHRYLSYTQAGKYEKAMADLKKSIELSPDIEERKEQVD